MFLFVLISILTYLLGWQLYIKDLKLITYQYNYRVGLPQITTFVAILIAVLLTALDIKSIHVGRILIFSILGFFFAFVSEFVWSKVALMRVEWSVSFRLCVVTILSMVLYICDTFILFPFILMGWYCRNTKFHVVHPNSFVIAKFFKHHLSSIVSDSVDCKIPESMPNFSHAGNQIKVNMKMSMYNVTEFGIKPDGKDDLTDRMQQLLDKVGEAGGGIIYFPKGRYLFNMQGKKQFLQINYSNIVIEGELDDKNNPLAILVNCGNLVRGERNPWLSPFFITTGEQLQKSNMFFGLQFRKKKRIVMRSASMSDPGSDGKLLTPQFATKVNKTSYRGEDLIYVEDSGKIDKYIILGLYNTDKEASLLKNILGQDIIRPEWQAAARAGEEEAPSFQWLVEVKEILDNNTVRLVQPLWRDCDLRYRPEVYNVLMLENITIRNLKLSSTWNGLFRHHGHKRYYSVNQAQEMDYGWNAINMKRVAHGNIENIIIENFTNPLYVMDSRNVTCKHITIKGHDGHQGIKVYEHACDNLFRDITFYSHYADMMGGEGNAYGNVFTEVRYLNPIFKPVHFDFHGFSEGPMSPPSYNLFEKIYGFDRINSSGAIHMIPSCARTNVWWNCYFEGEKKGTYIFYQRYRPKLSCRNKLRVYLDTGKKALSCKACSPKVIVKIYRETLERKKEAEVMSYTEIAKFYTDFYIYGVHTKSNLDLLDKSIIHLEYENKRCSPASLYDYQVMLKS